MKIELVATAERNTSLTRGELVQLPTGFDPQGRNDP